MLPQVYLRRVASVLLPCLLAPLAMYDNRTGFTLVERLTVYLYPIEIVGITLALISLMALVITTAIANARLTRRLKEWRDTAIEAQQ